MPFVISTATNDAYYPEYAPGGADLPVIKRKVLIKGGANRGGKHLHTPHGVATEVSEDDLEFLKAHPAFKRHVEKGFLTVVESKKEPEADKVALDMTPKDASAPRTPDDYPQEKKPVVGDPDGKLKKKGGRA